MPIGGVDVEEANKLQLIEQGADPTQVADRGIVYTKDAAGITELFYIDSAGNVTQVTSGGAPSINYWQRIGTVLSPLTVDDTLALDPGAGIDFNKGGVAKTLLYSKINSQFELNADVYTSGNISVDDNQWLYLNTAKTKGFQYITPAGVAKLTGELLTTGNIYIPSTASFEFDGVGRRLQWDNANTRFQFNGLVYASDGYWLKDNFAVTWDSGKTLKWVTAASRFEFDDDIYTAGNLILDWGTSGTIYGGSNSGDDLLLKANTVDAYSGLRINASGDVVYELFAGKSIKHNDSGNSFFVSNKLGSQYVHTTTSGNAVEVNAMSLTDGNALVVKVDSDIVTTGKAINVLSGSAGLTSVFNVNEDGDVYTSGEVMLDDGKKIYFDTAKTKWIEYGGTWVEHEGAVAFKDYVYFNDFATINADSTFFFDGASVTLGLKYSSGNARFEFNDDVHTSGNILLNSDKKIYLNTAHTISVFYNSATSRLEANAELNMVGEDISGIDNCYANKFYGDGSNLTNVTPDMQDNQWFYMNTADTKGVQWNTANSRFEFNDDVYTSGQWLGDGSALTGVTTPSSTDTFTNKTFDANGTGNSITNIDVADLANGTDGELITWDAAGAPATVAVGTVNEVLTSNGIGAAPTFQGLGNKLSALTFMNNCWETFGASTFSVVYDAADSRMYNEDSFAAPAGNGYFRFRIRLPDDFVSFPANAIALDTWYDNSTQALNFELTMEKGGANDLTIAALDITPTLINTWETQTATPGSSYSAGDMVTFEVYMNKAVGGASNYRVDAMTIKYNAKVGA